MMSTSQENDQKEPPKRSRLLIRLLLPFVGLVLWSCVEIVSHRLGLTFLDPRSFEWKTSSSRIIASQSDIDVFERQNLLCSNTSNDQASSPEWNHLCEAQLLAYLDDQLLLQNQKIHIVQIGAHVGFEGNDPLAQGLLRYLKLLPPQFREQIMWTFVEPSPVNYASLVANVHKSLRVVSSEAPEATSPNNTNETWCQVHTVPAGIVADTADNSQPLQFYHFHGDIDPVTGFDRRSGKQLPAWITQVSSFTMKPLVFNRGVFRRRGLNFWDYVVTTNVTVYKYGELLEDLIKNDTSTKSEDSTVALVLIDTEGFDCPIVSGIVRHLPQFLVFERKQCSSDQYQATEAHLQSLGYIVKNLGENSVAVRQRRGPGDR